MKMVNVPCKTCGKLVTVPENQKGTQVYCDKYCKSRDQILSIRNGRSRPKPVSRSGRSTRRSGCSSCGR